MPVMCKGEQYEQRSWDLRMTEGSWFCQPSVEGLASLPSPSTGTVSGLRSPMSPCPEARPGSVPSRCCTATRGCWRPSPTWPWVNMACLDPPQGLASLSSWASMEGRGLEGLCLEGLPWNLLQLCPGPAPSGRGPLAYFCGN